ncbi:unnamed protein product [Moneuplotes crassus]|uniref:Uncharacterized protein n=1 Tax=Euplotes crassus TaxID=5936 RepID=A0AAD1UC28_EUPCR|nr:unnamed protein product [Moneuplotes crassus]
MKKLLFQPKPRRVVEGLRAHPNAPSIKPIKSSSLRSMKFKGGNRRYTQSNSKLNSQNSNYSISNKKNFMLDLDFGSQDISIEHPNPSLKGSKSRPMNRPVKSRISVVDSNMLREKGNFLNFETQSRRAESKINKHQYTPVSVRSESKADPSFKAIEENIKARLKDHEERTVRASKRGNTVKIFDEKRLSIFIKAIKELLDFKLIPASLATLLLEGLDDSKRRIISHEKNMINMQQMIMKQVSDLDNQLKLKQSEVKETVKKCDEKMGKLKKENTKLKELATELQKELEEIRQKEIERLEDTDLDDVDIISEATKKKHSSKIPAHPLVPSLDFEKLRRIQEEEIQKLCILKNELDENIPFEESNNIKVSSQDVDFEESSSLSSQYKACFIPGSTINSQSEEALTKAQELMLRKAQVITELNEIYAQEGEGDEESGIFLEG